MIANKSHHATAPDEKYQVVPYRELYIDTGLDSAMRCAQAGSRSARRRLQAAVMELAADRIAGTAVDDRAGCAVLLEVAAGLAEAKTGRPCTSSFPCRRNSICAAPCRCTGSAAGYRYSDRSAVDRGHAGYGGSYRCALGGGPGISLYSFHGRGTLNGTIPHPALPALFEQAASSAKLPLQRSAQTGVSDGDILCATCRGRRGLHRCWLSLPIHPFFAGSL